MKGRALPVLVEALRRFVRREGCASKAARALDVPVEIVSAVMIGQAVRVDYLSALARALDLYRRKPPVGHPLGAFCRLAPRHRAWLVRFVMHVGSVREAARELSVTERVVEDALSDRALLLVRTRAWLEIAIGRRLEG